MKDLNESDPPLELKVVELGERVARLEALIEQHEKTFSEIRAEIRRLDAKIDRFFWLWVGTIAVGVVLRVMGLV